jgi:hypothetical protein
MRQIRLGLIEMLQEFHRTSALNSHIMVAFLNIYVSNIMQYILRIKEAHFRGRDVSAIKVELNSYH